MTWPTCRRATGAPPPGGASGRASDGRSSPPLPWCRRSLLGGWSSTWCGSGYWASSRGSCCWSAPSAGVGCGRGGGARGGAGYSVAGGRKPGAAAGGAGAYGDPAVDVRVGFIGSAVVRGEKGPSRPPAAFSVRRRRRPCCMCTLEGRNDTVDSLVSQMSVPFHLAPSCLLPILSVAPPSALPLPFASTCRVTAPLLEGKDLMGKGRAGREQRGRRPTGE